MHSFTGEGGKAREYKTSLHAIRAVITNEGISGLYVGLSAGLLVNFNSKF